MEQLEKLSHGNFVPRKNLSQHRQHPGLTTNFITQSIKSDKHADLAKK